MPSKIVRPVAFAAFVAVLGVLALSTGCQTVIGDNCVDHVEIDYCPGSSSFAADSLGGWNLPDYIHGTNALVPVQAHIAQCNPLESPPNFTLTQNPPPGTRVGTGTTQIKIVAAVEGSNAPAPYVICTIDFAVIGPPEPCPNQGFIVYCISAHGARNAATLDHATGLAPCTDPTFQALSGYCNSDEVPLGCSCAP